MRTGMSTLHELSAAQLLAGYCCIHAADKYLGHCPGGNANQDISVHLFVQ